MLLKKPKCEESQYYEWDFTFNDFALEGWNVYDNKKTSIYITPYILSFISLVQTFIL